jgi:hypothetical protein
MTELLIIVSHCTTPLKRDMPALTVSRPALTSTLDALTVARSNQLHVGRRLRRRARLRVPQSADYVCLLPIAAFERDEHLVADFRHEPGAAIPARHHRRYSRPEIAADDVGRGRHANQHTRQTLRIAIVDNRS